MSPRIEIVSELTKGGLDQLYVGYFTRVKNTFIDITPKHKGPKRSLSCSARFGISELYPTLLPTLETATPTTSKPTPEDEPASPSNSMTSADENEAVSTTVREHRLSVSSTCSASSWDQLQLSQTSVHEDFVFEQHQKYIVNTDDSGLTLMWHGLPTKYQVEPHLVGILDAISAENVEYLYLPVNHWEKKDKMQGKCRNKGYAFIHFRTEAAAADFTHKVTEHCTDKHRLTATTKAVHQGVSANLRALVSAPVKRTLAGHLYLQNTVGKLERISIRALRDLSSKMTKRASW
jgi:hypothetical protein